MKSLHRPDLFSWASFDEARNVDFNSTLWVREGGNVVFDPMPLTDHNRAHLMALGGAAWVVVTNSDHVRATEEVMALTGAKLAAPAGERDDFPLPVDRWLADGDELVPGCIAYAMEGSKTPGELVLHVEDALITGDLVRAHKAGGLMMLPEAKLTDPAKARASVERLHKLPRVEAVLVGDGWPVFRFGHVELTRLLYPL